MLLVIVCNYDQGAGEKEILSYPVVAIRSAIRTEYVRAARPGDEGLRKGATHEEMTDLSYRIDTLGCHLDDDLFGDRDLDGATRSIRPRRSPPAAMSTATASWLAPGHQKLTGRESRRSDGRSSPRTA